MFSTIELNTFEPVNQQIYRILRKAIITCQILPGCSLSEKEISMQFNVSRQPVRESFIKLAENGLVQVLPQRGTFVTKISIKKVIDGQFIREAVECAVIEKAARVIKDIDIKKLELNLLEQHEAFKTKNSDLFLEKDEEFHQILINSIDCTLAWDVIENIKAMMDRVRFLSLDGITPLTTLIEQHQSIFEAIKNHDSEQAAAAQRTHLRAILDSIIVIAKQNQELFID